jgi:hypothetical protein
LLEVVEELVLEQVLVEEEQVVFFKLLDTQ